MSSMHNRPPGARIRKSSLKIEAFAAEESRLMTQFDMMQLTESDFTGSSDSRSVWTIEKCGG